MSTATALALVASAGLFSCGGGPDFASKADGVCTAEAVAVNGVLSDGGTPGDASEAAAQSARLLPIERQATVRLRAIEQPGGRAGAAFGEFQAGRRHALGLSRRRARAARRGLRDAYVALGARRDRVIRAADAAAARAGLPACAERLSRGEARAVGVAITAIATRPDPSLCAERFTANFLRTQFGSPAGCRRRQRRPSSAARSVRIERLRGIDRVYALATVVPRGGDYGGQRVRLGLLYEGGAYRADTLEGGR